MKSEYQRAKDLLDKVFSIYIRTRDKKRFNGICPICSQRDIECCFHFLPRGNMATRFEPDNCVGSCRGCNYLEHWSRGNAKLDERFRSVWVRLVGEERVRQLEFAKGTIWKKSKDELLEIKREFERKLAKGEY